MWRMLMGAAVVGLLSLPSQAVVLRYRFQPGEVHRYVIQVSGSSQVTSSMMPSTSSKFTSRIQYLLQTLAVNPDGSYTLRLKPESATMTLEQGENKQSIALPIPVLRIVLTPRGEIKSIQPEGQATIQVPGMSGGGIDFRQLVGQVMGSLVFPVGDVSVGQTWKNAVKISGPLMTQPVQLNVVSKLSGITNYKGRTCAVIDSTFEMPLNLQIPQMGFVQRGSVKGTTRTYFDIQAGKAVAGVGSFQSYSTAQASMPSQAQGTASSFSITSQVSGNIQITMIQ